MTSMDTGLFGDLPSAKNEALPLEVSGSSKDDQTPIGTAPPSTGASADAPPSAASVKKGPSLVQSIGNAGTTFALIPATLRRKKAAVTPSIASSSTTSVGGGGTKRLRPSHARVAALAEERLQQSYGHDSSVNEQEPDWLLQLHVSVQPEDRYDPLVPNDYLTYLEQRKAVKERAQMELQAKDQLEMQKKMRERIELERKAAEEAGDLDRIVESRVGTVIAGGKGRGRGRGGSTNLPAWLVKKRQDERIGGTSAAVPPASANLNTRYADAKEEPLSRAFPPTALGRLFLLGNIDPLDADNELAGEVKEECEEKCGPVMSVRVRPGETEVSVFVQFVSAEDASMATKIFEGRSFGARKICARLAQHSDLI